MQANDWEDATATDRIAAVSVLRLREPLPWPRRRHVSRFRPSSDTKVIIAVTTGRTEAFALSQKKNGAGSQRKDGHATCTFVG